MMIKRFLQKSADKRQKELRQARQFAENKAGKINRYPGYYVHCVLFDKPCIKTCDYWSNFTVKESCSPLDPKWAYIVGNDCGEGILNDQ